MPYANEVCANRNMKIFQRDLQDDGFVVSDPVRRSGESLGGGRYPYALAVECKGRTRIIEVDMPGIPVPDVRFGTEDILDFPRVYVDGSSWAWDTAVKLSSPCDEDD